MISTLFRSCRRPAIRQITRGLVLALTLAGLAAVAGCSGGPPSALDQAGYTTTLNHYYAGRPLCVWPNSVKFPVEGQTPGADDRGFTALTDAGLLVRKPAGESSSYELTPEGRTALNVDIAQPGAGNFCYGHRTVVSIDADHQSSDTTELVDFHYSSVVTAAWARQAAVQQAFPQVSVELTGAHQAAANLLNTTAGWKVAGTGAASSMAPPTPLERAMAVLHFPRKPGAGGGS